MSDISERNGRRDILVIGGSGGALKPLKTILSALPADLDAAVFVVLHVGKHSPSLLPAILTRAGPLAAMHPRGGEPIRPGRIYVAPPDRHMVIDDGRVVLNTAPTENRHRPAIDPLFRSAAQNYGPRVVGVLLSGARDDGTAGLISVKNNGGMALVQDPHDAQIPSMPASALRFVNVDQVLSAAEIGTALSSALPVGNGASALATSSSHAQRNPEADQEMEVPTPIACPDCGGVLWQTRDEGGFPHFRCRVGHAYSPASLARAQADDIEGTLWAALRALEDRATLADRMAERAASRRGVLAKSYRMEAHSMRARAETLRGFIRSLLETPVTEKREKLEAAG